MKPLLFVAMALFMTVFAVHAQSTVERKTFVYAVKDGMDLQLDRYVDNRSTTKGKRPVMLYVHGGGFATGGPVNALQIQYGKHFAAQGFVAVMISYRLGIKGGTQPSQDTVMRAISMATEDLIDATAFILSKADEWNVDGSKIIISGGSAGAITCLNAEYALCSGGKLADRLPKGFNYAAVVSHAGAIIVQQDTLTWKKAPCPMLLMHGNKDQSVPFNSYSLSGNLYAGSNYIHNQFVKLNFPHWLYEEMDADHIVAIKPLQYNFGEIDAFINKFVMSGQQAIVHTTWADKKPDSMQDMMKVVPLYINGWNKTDDEVNAKGKQ